MTTTAADAGAGKKRKAEDLDADVIDESAVRGSKRLATKSPINDQPSIKGFLKKES